MMIYDELTEAEKNKLKDVMNSLLVHTFINGTVYSKQLDLFIPNDEYALANKYFEAIKETMNRLGFETFQDTMADVIYISDFPSSSRTRIDKETTMLLLVLYQIKSEGEKDGDRKLNSTKPSITIRELEERMLALGLWKKVPSQNAVSKSLRQILKFRFIEKDGPLSSLETRLFLMDSINLMLNRDKSVALIAAFKDKLKFVSETPLDDEEKERDEEDIFIGEDE